MFGEKQGGFVWGVGETKRGRGRQGQRERRSKKKKIEDGWVVGSLVSRTTFKWLRCFHGNSNEGSQDTLGGYRRKSMCRGGGGEGRMIVKK